jgi:ankyrin repeat protein
MQSTKSTISTNSTETVDPSFLSTWFDAFENYNPEKIDELLNRPDLSKFINNARKHNGMTALMISVRSGLSDPVRKLIQKSADINIQKFDGDTALHYAARNNSSEIFYYLLMQPGISVDLKNSNKRSPLNILVILQRQKDVCEMLTDLIKKGADVNNQHNTGLTPLMDAAKELLSTSDDSDKAKLNYKIISILIKAGARQTLPNINQGENFRDYIMKGSLFVRNKIAEITGDNSYLPEVKQEVKPNCPSTCACGSIIQQDDKPKTPVVQELTNKLPDNKQNATEPTPKMSKIDKMTKIAEFCILNNIEFSFKDGNLDF